MSKREPYCRIELKQEENDEIKETKINNTFLAIAPRNFSIERSGQNSMETEAQKTGLWDQSEDKNLLKAHAIIGPKWVQISNYIKGRNHRQCEKRFRRIKKAELIKK